LLRPKRMPRTAWRSVAAAVPTGAPARAVRRPVVTKRDRSGTAVWIRCAPARGSGRRGQGGFGAATGAGQWARPRPRTCRPSWRRRRSRSPCGSRNGTCFDVSNVAALRAEKVASSLQLGRRRRGTRRKCHPLLDPCKICSAICGIERTRGCFGVMPRPFGGLDILPPHIARRRRIVSTARAINPSRLVVT
jgi:hypothetical protein